VFVETVEGRTTRTTYAVTLDRLSVRTERAHDDAEWTPILVGTYRRR